MIISREITKSHRSIMFFVFRFSLAKKMANNYAKTTSADKRLKYTFVIDFEFSVTTARTIYVDLSLHSVRVLTDRIRQKYTG